MIAHIVGMDAYAAGLRIAARLLEDGVFEENLKQRYRSYNEGIGKQIINGEVGFKELEAYVLNKKELDANESGKQELLEAILNQYIIG